MTKLKWKPGTMLYPLPAVMVSCGHTPQDHNIITIAWTGVVNTDPPMVYISVRPHRHSFEILKKTGDFVINLTTKDLARATDWNGVKSGKDIDKASATNLTYSKATEVGSPVIEESPVNIECRIKDIIPLGTHHMFLAEVVAVLADEKYINQNGKFDMKKAGLIAYVHGNYYELGNLIGHFGFSVKKKKKRKKKS
jgi:flavin reductase (DIM6/NTAB) family NADH-FMN oxidoreductase RutF